VLIRQLVFARQPKKIRLTIGCPAFAGEDNLLFHTIRSYLSVAQPYLLAAVVACLLTLSTGCGSGGATVHVSGKITFQDKPVTSGLINFLPASGRPLGGGIQADGTYQYQLPPGEYKVRIDTPPAIPAGWKEGDPPPKMGPRQVP